MELMDSSPLKDTTCGNQAEKEVRAEGPVLFVEPRKLLRQCFEECFNLSSIAGRIVAIPDIAEWLRMADAQPLPSAVFIYLPATANVRSEIENTMAAFSEQGSVPPVLIVADNEEPAHVLDALDAGGKGYIPSSASLEVAIKALQLVLAGGTYVPASALVASRNLAKGATAKPERSPHSLFTDRQHAVIEKLREGKPNKIIAYELEMRESTVKVHIRNLMRKLNATNRTQVAYLYQAMLTGSSASIGV
jgi:DNA-binding NarL/FixJ family response regulator